ncbi:hypothetical protein, partial [Kitasatospora nipponensis]|uniref:hypothetical protein n=1 Tax=Kitasatospora nipponensis TaxID=258049 RepID=UPI0031DEDA09
MTNQGAPAQQQPADEWWTRVYEGPAGTLPDTPAAEAGDGSVDDWFDAVASIVGPVAEAEAEAAEVEEAVARSAASRASVINGSPR